MDPHTLYLLGKGALAAALIALIVIFLWGALSIVKNIGKGDSLSGPMSLWNLTSMIGSIALMTYFLTKLCA